MRPEQPPIFEPHAARYWDPADLEGELRRVLSICHGCRMCVSFCPAFPELFDRVDGYVKLKRGELDAFKAEDFKAVNDLCYQCKLCYIKCPYTPDDEHPFMVDFPRLMLRQRAQRARRDGVSVQDQVMGEPQVVGRVGGMAARFSGGLSNVVSTHRLLRKVQEKATGISAEFNLPPFAAKSLRQRVAQRTPGPRAGEQGEVALFSTCTTDFNLPSTGIAAIQVLEHNGLSVAFPLDQTCCGMPNLDGGDLDGALRKAKRNVETLLPFVTRDVPIVVPGPTCSYVLKKEYPELLGTPEARLVAEHTFDLMEWLNKRMREGLLSREFVQPLGRIGYHAACHLRAQKIGTPGRLLLAKVPGTEISTVEECSAVDGTWGMKAQHYELGRKYSRKLVWGLSEQSFDALATDCPLSGQRIAAEMGTVAFHPIELLNRAYGLPEAGPANLPRPEDIARKRHA